MRIKSRIIPLVMKDVDTDLIIPADYLKGTGKDGLGQFVFKRLRDEDKNFPFNLPEYADSEILVVQDNFGCGSSREHAAWALKDWGVKVIVAPSFSDIFHSNAFKNGLLPIVLGAEVVETLLERASEDFLELDVDLSMQSLSLPGGETFDFEIDPYRKYCLINGMDDLDYLLSNADDIKTFEAGRARNLFCNLDKI